MATKTQTPIETLRLLITRTEIEIKRGTADGSFLPLADDRAALEDVEALERAAGHMLTLVLGWMDEDAPHPKDFQLKWFKNEAKNLAAILAKFQVKS